MDDPVAECNNHSHSLPLQQPTAEVDTPAQPTESSVPASSPILRLPVEIRQEIYRLFLPSQRLAIRSSSWVNIYRPSNAFVGLLGVNRQIRDEALAIVHGAVGFSAALPDYPAKRRSFQGLSDWLRPLPSTGSIGYTKHWELCLKPELPKSPYQLLHVQVKQNIRAISVELLKVPNLQSLKVKVPCFCPYYSGIAHGYIFEDGVYQNAVHGLQTLQHIRVTGQVTVMTVQDLCHDTQCQRIACLHLAAAFPDMKTTVQSRLTTWAGLNNKASIQLPEDDPSAPRYDPNRLYFILDSLLEASYAAQASYAAPARIFGLTLDHRLRDLHETGRLEHFLDYEKEGIPAERWEEMFRKKQTRERAKRQREEAREKATAAAAEARKRPRRSARTMTKSHPSYKY
ncbi:MAG: hypothetical protein LQ346_003483 [Caloplaca aetnensis]|nr:MAG: hypothetical protein LQ346_003483 [Caloplaca aetnensis]